MFIIIDVCSIVECISNEVFLKKYQKSELNIILTIKLMKQYYKIIKNNEKFFQENPRSIKLLNHICKSNHYWTDDSDKYNFYCDGQIPKEDLYLLNSAKKFGLENNLGQIYIITKDMELLDIKKCKNGKNIKIFLIKIENLVKNRNIND